MKLPLLISVPHAGVTIPREVTHLCILREQDIREDGDEGACEIYRPLDSKVMALVTTDISRAIVDMNRKEDDRRKDGVIKTHTCWDVPVYKEPLSGEVIELLMKRYYRPYHSDLSRLSDGVILGVDCHTMAAEGPPIGPDPGIKRPHICISNGDGTCSREWLESLSECFERAFNRDVSRNHPFKGGHIIRSHSKEIPWIQLELSRDNFLSNEQKGQCVFEALSHWSNQTRRA